MNKENENEIITKQEIFSQKTEKISANNAEIKSKKSIIILVFATIGLLLLFISFILPWWGYLQINDRYNTMTGESVIHSESGFGVPISRGWGSEAYNGHTSLYSGNEKVPLLFLITTLLVILALISIALFILSILYEISQNRKTKLPRIFGVLALIFCLLAPLVFMTALPAAMEADRKDPIRGEHDDPSNSFFGSYEETNNFGSMKETLQKRWGGDIGWFLACFSFVMILMSLIMFLKDEQKAHNIVHDNLKENSTHPDSLP